MKYHYVKCAGCGEELKRNTSIKENGAKKPRCFACKKEQTRKYNSTYKRK